MATPAKKTGAAKAGSSAAPLSTQARAKAGKNEVQSAQRQRVRPETRAEMLERLTNPQISLHETSVILRVCSATVRQYCNAGFLPHLRTPGGQRRFYLREVLAFLREREAEKRKK